MKILRRLKKEERENIEEQFENGLLYRFVCDVALHFHLRCLCFGFLQKKWQ